MSYLAVVGVPLNGSGRMKRTLATRSTSTRAEARAWVATNRETFRGVLEAEEECFVVWVLTEEGAIVLTLRHSREWGSEGEVVFRAPVRAKAARTRTKEGNNDERSDDDDEYGSRPESGVERSRGRERGGPAAG